ncbi:ABC transporter permease subunit [Evansella sp. AB-P1]|uniref:ABC transporter permease subunit n=1 Tax=Evansella sp. AB-P1 TaxID=3037653 RepID=UPI00241F429F|nr:ABC transporter permease subunit [Evansella sp. AB-P1]MDG5786346.1 ABC transporter permease subunit [Evansella sp. AB-P1]
MFHKGLWYQNYKQTKMVVWILLVLFVIHLPFQTILLLESWRSHVKHMNEHFPGQQVEFHAFEIYNLYFQGIFPFIVMFGIIFLACLLIGVERNTRRMDFTFSLPFSRKDMFLSKWLYGMLLIFVFHIVNFFISYFTFMQSEFSSELGKVTLIEIFYGPLIGYLLVFTFALFIGTITGEMISQIALTFIFGIFPIGVMILVQSLIEVHFGYSRFWIENLQWVENITIFNFVLNHQGNEFLDLLYPLIGIALFTILSIFLYERNKIEHNGEFLIFKQLNPIFLVGITICFALLGGIIISSLAPWNATTLRIIAYWIGVGIFLLFSYLITRRLLRMNIMIKNK